LRNRKGKRALGSLAVVAALVIVVVGVSPAGAADDSPPVLAAGAFATLPDGNSNWRLTAPQTLNLSATDDVAVSKFQYSLDGGVTYIDVPVTAGPSATAAVPLSQEGNTAVRYRAVDSSGNVSRGAIANTTLNAPAAAGSTAVRLTSTTGRSAGDLLVIDTGAAQETATIAGIVTPAPPAPAPNVTLAAPLANDHAAAAAVQGIATYLTITLQLDTKGPVATWATQATTLQPTSATVGAPAAAPGDTQIRLASTAGRAAGNVLQLDQGENAEAVTIASVVDPPPAAPAANVVLTAPVTKTHLSGSAVYLPQIVGGKVLQSQTLTPLRTDPRRRDATDTVANGAGNAAPRRMTLDGVVVIPKAQPLNRLTVGKHVQTVALQDTAGSVAKHTNTFVVTTSFDDLATVIDQYAANARNTTLNVGATTLNQPSAPGATGVRLQSTAGLFAGDVVLIDTGAGQESATIASIPSPAPASPNPNVLLTAPLANAHLAAAPVSFTTPVGATGLRFADATRYGFRAGETLVVDTGANQETVTIGKVLSPPSTLSTTLSAPAAAGATAVRLASYTTSTTPATPTSPAPSNNGPIIGQPIALDRGASQEIVTVARHIEPVPPAPEPNVILSAPLAKDHPVGAPTVPLTVVLSSPLTKPHANGVPVSNPQPFISAATAASLKALLAQAKAAADAGNTAGAIDALSQFTSAVFDQVKPSAVRKAERAALSSAARALIDELKGGTVDTTGTGVTVGPADPGDQAVRTFWNPTPFQANPAATYKILINGRSGGFRHQSIVDFEAMFQKLGAENGFDVEVWDPNINQGPGRQAPAGVSLTTNPFLDLATLMQYKTLVFDSTVGLNAAGLNATEFANLQAYMRAGGGFVAIHGATDSMQNVPWYMDLVGAGFTNHGGNSGGILIDTESGGHVEFVNADPASAANSAFPARFLTVEELYNTNRNPAELGIVHPLVYENEDTLVGQLGYSTGALMNSDEHAMVWCRNFDGGRSFTTTLGHSWQFATEPWFVQQLLAAVKWTAGVAYLNCVTYNEVSELLAAAVATGGVNSAGNTVLSGLLADARAEFEAGNYRRAASILQQFIHQTKQAKNCRSATTGGCPDSGAALGQLTFKGQELQDWANGLQ
jgi:type 1 glutamine amidotransferase